MSFFDFFAVTPEVAIGLASTFLAACTIGWTFFEWRKKELRRDEVLHWGNEAIEVLQLILLECRSIYRNEAPDQAELRLLARRASVLIEQGRIFFRNTPPKRNEEDISPAYRGYRPRILDVLVSSFKIAEAVSSLEIDDVRKCVILAHKNLQQLVSLLQTEVGRDRTRSADTSVGGIGIELPDQLAQIGDGTPKY